MGFLSGVLSNIQRHLGQHKGEITSAIDILEEKKHSGKKGFNDAIGSVVDGVGRYNDNVAGSNQKIKTTIITLLDYVKRDGGKLIKDINALQVETLTDGKLIGQANESITNRLDECERFASAFNNNFNLTDNEPMRNAVNDLNDKLCNDVKYACSAVKHESDRLGQQAKRGKENYDSMAAKVRETLNALGTQVNNHISEKVTVLVNNLKGKVKEIWEDLKKIDKKLRDCIHDLEELIKSSLDVIKLAEDRMQEIQSEIREDASWNGRGQVSQVAEAIHTQLRGEIQELEKWNKEATDAVKRGIENCEKILERVQNDHVKNVQHNGGKTVIKKKADELKTNAVALRTAAESAMTRVKAKVTEALKTVVSMNDELKQDLNDVKKKVNEAVEAVKTEIGKLHDVIEKGQVEGAANMDNQKIEALMKKIIAKVVSVKNKVGDESGSGAENEGSIYHNWTEIKKKIKTQTDKMSNTTLSAANGFLNRIENGVRKYAGAFQSNFKAAMGTMIDAIVDSGAVDGKIRAYVVSSSGASGVPDNLNAVKEAMKKLIKAIDSAGKPTQTGGDVETALNNIQHYLEGYGKAVKEKITGIKNFVDSIKRERDASSHLSGVDSSADTHLTDAVSTVLTALSSAVERMTAEIRSLTSDKMIRDEYDLGKNLDGIIICVEDIKTQIDKDAAGYASNHGARIDMALKQVTSNIKDLHGNLAKALSDSSGVPKRNHAASVDAAIEKVRSDINDHLQTDTINVSGGVADKVKLDNLNRYKVYVKQDPPLLETPSGTEGSLITAIKNAETAGLKDLEDKIGTAAGKEGITSATFEIPFDAILKQLDYLTLLINNPKKDSYNNKGVKTLLNDLQTGFANTALGDAKGLQTIQDSLTRLHNELPTVTTNLVVLCNTISNAGAGVELHLDTLRDTKIKRELVAIKDRIIHIQSTLDKEPMKKAKDFDNYATRLKVQIVTALHEFVNQKVEVAKNEIANYARKQYISSAKELLTAFAGKVETELKTLPNRIDQDLEIGHKKFMTLFADNFVNELRSIESINPKFSSETESPLSNAAKTFESSFRAFFKVFKNLGDFKSDYRVIRPIHKVLTKLLEDIKNSRYFNHDFSMNVNDLNRSLVTFTPSKSPNCKNPVILETLKNGVLATCEQLGYAYINTYDSMSITWVGENDPEKNHCAKICMTTFPILYNAFAELKQGLEKSEKSWQLYTMYNSGNMDYSLRKLFFGENGYDVGRPATSPYGELNHKSTFDGSNVLANLTNKTHNLFSPGHARLAGALSSGAHIIPVEYADEDGLIPDLYALLKPYAQVCHLSTFSSTKSPCSVFEMLLWCSGLQFNGVYDKLCDYCDSLFDKVADNADPEHKILAPIAAYPKAILAFDVSAAIEHIVSRSYQLLTAVLGTGNAYAMYACDFPINTLGLKYPTSGADCLDMLLDVLRRLCPVLHYLYRQCNITANHGGWRDCFYGKDIKTSKWPCKVHPTDVSNNERTCQANYQPNCQPNCQATSPLMSYLHDSLPGHLPHDISSIGCRAVCSTCPKVKKGMPCVTPLGFRGFTGSVKTGRELCEILRDFFANSYITTLFGLIPRPPTSLPEHFEFALQLANVLNNDGSGREAVRAAFVKSTKDQSIDLYNEPSKLTTALCNAYNSNIRHDVREHPNVSDADLSTLSKETTCNYPNKNVHCAPYLSTLYSDYYYYAAEKHATLYLSWAVYLPWTFYEFLKSLLDAFGNISCQDWGCGRCQRGDKCKPGKHGVDYNCRCRGLVECRGVRSILYAYGFTFGNAEVLSDFEHKRYCHNLYKQLQNVLNSDGIKQLFDRCDEYIFTIRQPFIWLNVALWSLSLFYLICVMVGRLDLLHIRSHLRIPSSHRITAQSLLAAAQVGRLAKISYLQP